MEYDGGKGPPKLESTKVSDLRRYSKVVYGKYM